MSRVHVLLTGAAGGIGSAFARRFRARHPDALFTLVDLDEARAEDLSRELGAASAEAWDLSQPAALAGHLEAAVERSGPVDVLVNCAGIMEMRSFAATPWELGDRLMAIDLTSPLRLMSLVVPSMVERGAGAILNVTSMAGVTPLRGCSYYGAAKAGLAMASEIARLELSPKGVRVTTVYPGPVRSELERRARAQVPEGLVSRFLPTGEAEPLAAKMVAAYEKGAARVVYPSLYELANRAPRFAGWVTSKVSPIPHE